MGVLSDCDGFQKSSMLNFLRPTLKFTGDPINHASRVKYLCYFPAFHYLIITQCVT